MWSVFKEPEVYLLPDKPNNYHRLCPILKETLGTVDPVRWIHLGDYREGVYNLMIGYCWDGDTRPRRGRPPAEHRGVRGRLDPGPRDPGDVHPRRTSSGPPTGTPGSTTVSSTTSRSGSRRCRCRALSGRVHRRLPGLRGAGREGADRVPPPTEVPPDRLHVPLLLERPVPDHGLRLARLLPAPVPGVRGDEGGVRAGADQPRSRTPTRTSSDARRSTNEVPRSPRRSGSPTTTNTSSRTRRSPGRSSAPIRRRSRVRTTSP